MTVAVAIHLFGGLLLLMHWRQQVDGSARNPLLHIFRLVLEHFAALLLLHLIQVGLWALLYWWQIGWDLNTVLYFSTTTYATIG
jgi:hypothetical protein